MVGSSVKAWLSPDMLTDTSSLYLDGSFKDTTMNEWKPSLLKQSIANATLLKKEGKKDFISSEKYTNASDRHAIKM